MPMSGASGIDGQEDWRRIKENTSVSRKLGRGAERWEMPGANAGGAASLSLTLYRY